MTTPLRVGQRVRVIDVKSNQFNMVGTVISRDIPYTNSSPSVFTYWVQLGELPGCRSKATFWREDLVTLDPDEQFPVPGQKLYVVDQLANPPRLLEYDFVGWIVRESSGEAAWEIRQSNGRIVGADAAIPNLGVQPKYYCMTAADAWDRYAQDLHARIDSAAVRMASVQQELQKLFVKHRQLTSAILDYERVKLTSAILDYERGNKHGST